MAVAAAIRINPPGSIDEGHDRIQRTARITTGAIHKTRHINRDRLRTLKVHVNLHIVRVHTPNGLLHRREKTPLTKAGYMNGTDFREEEISLLVNDQNVVIASSPPDTNDHTVARSEDVVFRRHVAERTGKTPFKQIGSKWTKDNRSRGRERPLSPSRCRNVCRRQSRLAIFLREGTVQLRAVGAHHRSRRHGRRGHRHPQARRRGI